jgi:phage minor structural protein
MFYILNKQEKITNVVENKGDKNALFYYDDIHINKIAEGGTRIFLETLEFSLAGNKEEVEKIEEGYKVIYEDKEGYLKLFEIYLIEESINGISHTKKCFSYNSLIIDLNKTIIETPKSFQSSTYKDILAYVLNKTEWIAEGFKEGIVSVDIEAKRAMAGLDVFLSLAELEIEAFIEYKDNKIIKKIKLQRQKGSNKGIRFEYKNNLKGATRKKSNLELYTKLYVFGKVKEDGTRVNLKNVNQILDENNTLINSEYVLDIQAQYKYNKNKKYSEGIIFNDNIADEYELLSFANEQLAIYNHPKNEYTVELALLEKDTKLGDTIYIIDKEINLYISSRVIEKQTSKSGLNDSLVLGEFTTYTVEIPNNIWELRAIAEKALEEAKNNSWKVEVSTPNGLDFQTVGEKKLVIAKVFQGLVDITNTITPSSFKWEVLNKDGTKNATLEALYVDIGNEIEVGIEISDKTLRLNVFNEII